MILIGTMALLMTACGDDDATTSTAPAVTASTAAPAATVATPTTVAATTTTVAATTTTAAAHPGSPFVSQVTDGYIFGSEQGQATNDDLPFELGSIDVHWYQAGGMVVAVYNGLDPASSEYLCPGNSILTNAGFEHVSNAAVPGADCSNSFGTIDSVPGVSGGQLCNGLVSYITAIPSNLDGELFGTIEVYPPTGRFVGATGTVLVTGADLPEIDPASLSC
jgi:hypothetical protein